MISKTRLVVYCGVLLAVITLISDLGGAYSTLKNVWLAIHDFQISALYLLILIPLIGYIVYLHLCRETTHPSAVVSIENAGQYYQQIQAQFISAKQHIVVVNLEKDWVFPLIVSLAIARSRNCAVSVIYSQEPHERYRLLELIGCEVVKITSKTEKDHFVGVLSDPDHLINCRATIRTASLGEAVYGRYYFSAFDHYVISASWSHLKNIMRSIALEPQQTALPLKYLPTFVEVSNEEIITRLKTVRFYNHAQISMQEVHISDTRPVSRFIPRFKYYQVQEIIRLYQEKGWALFRPSGFVLASGKTSILVPPVLEEHEGVLYVAEGHTRLYAMLESGQKTIFAIVVRGVSTSLPMEPTTWGKVTLVDEKKKEGDIKLARSIETCTHARVWERVS